MRWAEGLPGAFMVEVSVSALLFLSFFQGVGLAKEGLCRAGQGWEIIAVSLERRNQTSTQTPEASTGLPGPACLPDQPSGKAAAVLLILLAACAPGLASRCPRRPCLFPWA